MNCQVLGEIPSRPAEAKVPRPLLADNEDPAAQGLRLRPRLGHGSGSVSSISVGVGKHKFIARITICGIAISSQCIDGEDEAEGVRVLLSQMRTALDNLSAEAGFSVRLEGLLAAFVEKPRHTEGSLEFAPLQLRSWSFRVLVDVRAWTGRILSSRRVTSVAEAIAMREQLEEAKCRGWVCFREVWSQCMSHSRAGLAQTAGRASTAVSRTSSRAARLLAVDLSHAKTQRHALKRAQSRQTIASRREALRVHRTTNRIAKLTDRIERALGMSAMASHRRD
mmetsp:Transcript_178388/g.565957  ORF Transcript_178388/g.565957 Transcript_178388/m.565957 type:complete len:280 (-) Transcript_178388:410-1249(-)